MSLTAHNLAYAVDSDFIRGNIYLLEDVSLSAPAASVTAIMGPSGAGKSKTCELLFLCTM